MAFFIDDKFVGGATSNGLADETIQISTGYVYEPGSADARTLTAKARDTCQDGNHFTVTSVKVSVSAIR